MIKLLMKIPVFEDGIPLNITTDVLHEMEFNHAQAVEMAIENVAWQADDTYFDASLEIWLDDKLFFKQDTTDAFGLWCDLLNALEKPGKHQVMFLDSSQDLTIDHREVYEFLFVHTDYEWDDNDFLVSMTKTTILSGPLQKDAVEAAIKEAFMLYADFILQHDIPIAEAYMQELEQRRKYVKGDLKR